MQYQRGFTLIELVTIIIILGIISVVALPRMSAGDDILAAEFRDKVVSSLRYAQKMASSHRRLVCVTFTASSLTLQIARQKNVAACDADLPIPGAGGNVVSSRNPASIVFNPVPAALNFQPDGTANDRTLLIGGQPAIVIIGATGHVR